MRPGADAGPGADGARCAASADAAGDAAAGGAVRCMPGAAGVRPSADAAGGAAAGGAVYAGRGWCATGSGRLEKLRIKEAMTRGALPHDGGGRRFFLPGSRRFERPSAACAPTAEVAWLRSLPPRQARRRAHRSRHGCGSAPVPLRASVSSVHLGVEGSGATRRKRPPQADFFDARSARV